MIAWIKHGIYLEVCVELVVVAAGAVWLSESRFIGEPLKHGSLGSEQLVEPEVLVPVEAVVVVVVELGAG